MSYRSNHRLAEVLWRGQEFRRAAIRREKEEATADDRYMEWKDNPEDKENE